MERKEILNKAEQLLSHSGYDSRSDTYIDVTKLAMSLGFRVGESRKLSFKYDGFMSVSEDSSKLLIGVNYDRTIEEKRFIVAHELAHYCLHYINSNMENAIMHREHIKGKGEIENDADYFAACIIMPCGSFKSKYNDLIDNGYELSDVVDRLQIIFKAPRESVQRRIKEVCKDGENTQR